MTTASARSADPGSRKALLFSLLSLGVPAVGRSFFPDTIGHDFGLLIWILALVPAFLLSYYHGWRGASVALAGGMATFALGESVLLLIGKSPPPVEIVLGMVVVLIAVSLGAGWIAELYRASLNRAREEALTDAGTRLPNRRAALLYLEKAFHAAVRGGVLSVVLFDLDRFKAVNDEYGHATGDEVLRRFGAILASVTRTMNISARYGGEEFLAVLSNCDAKGALVFCERVRQRLADADLPVVRVTVSAGIAQYEHGMASQDVLIAAADQALYRAKAKGRDRVEVMSSGDGHRIRSAREITPRADPGPGTQGRGERILVVDDDDAARSSMARALRRFGYSVLEAGSATRALQIARGLDEPVDLVVTDIVMPDIRGFSFVEMLQEIHPPVRVVYTSGYSQEEVEWAGVPGLTWRFIAKPVAIGDLARTVEEVLTADADGVGTAACQDAHPAAVQDERSTAGRPSAASERALPLLRPVLSACDDLVPDAPIVVLHGSAEGRALVTGMLRDAGFGNVRSTAAPEGIDTGASPDLVVADPGGDGPALEKLLALTSAEDPDGRTPLLLLTGARPARLDAAFLDHGLVEILEWPVDRISLASSARNLLRIGLLGRALVRERNAYQDGLAARGAELHESRSDLLRRLARSAEFRDDATGEHVERVGRLAALLAAELGWSPAQVSLIEEAATLHDVGKIAVPDVVLLKPGRLSPSEWETMRRHTVLGAQLLAGSRNPVLRMAEEIALTHHERWDGSGYPHELAGSEIPVAGRIVAVADAYDSQVHRRPYRKPVARDEAIRELMAEAGHQFDPVVVDAFVNLARSGRLEEVLVKDLVVWPDGGGDRDGSGVARRVPRLARSGSAA